ncbi:putative bifunctional diguanylate cyclase/phosphodiesterase [Novosphingobium sp. JCM 18896]|uniref:putative bifunctional diguanylate cyclase/phosphodiesterase n=1 Tax=Novosphingobium sp. JCM 18896 TaxID=2989731 RepID=UPI0022213231|nr:EAL domain-containing protein [Novosphingobium sp. JCM 18896]MCW1427556.1 EAL domain-containing protein [Novosphingobium sp. JCM 18896]
MKPNFREDFLGRELVSEHQGADFAGWPAAQPQAVETDLAAFYQEALNEAAIVDITDPLGTILSVNDRFCELTGYTRGELVGTNHRMLRSNEHDWTFFRQMQREIMLGHVWRGEICNRSKNGDLFWVDTTIVPHRRRNGQIERFIAIRFDVTARRQAEERLRRLANVDQVTNLPNRNAFMRSVEDIIADTRATPGRIAVGILDVDHFKEINDCLGHGAGDALLQELALRLRAAMGRNDEVARLGGDEFGIILRDCASEDVVRQRIAGIFQAFAKPIPVCGSERLLSASLGMAMLPVGPAGRDELLKNADIALHEAKANGRGRAELFGEEMQEAVHRRAALREAFQRGLHEGEFVVHYQPIVSLVPGAPVAMEALLRWNHPELGLIRPPQFIEALSDEHLAAQVGCYVIDVTVRQIEQWHRDRVRFASISINATLGDFRSGRYVDAILAAIADGRIGAGDIRVEINEDVLMGRGGDCARSEIDRLHKAGVAIAFDDFGTGFASLRHLRDMPVQVVKIDKSFIRSIEHDRADRAIVGNVISLAHQLGKTVTAEGVETREQAEVLKELGCDLIQGFLVAPAIAASEIEPLLRADDVTARYGLA